MGEDERTNPRRQVGELSLLKLRVTELAFPLHDLANGVLVKRGKRDAIILRELKQPFMVGDRHEVRSQPALHEAERIGESARRPLSPRTIRPQSATRPRTCTHEVPLAHEVPPALRA